MSRGLDFVRAVSAPGLSLSSACFWSSSPQPPQPQVPETPWADEGGSVYHLTDEDFDQFVKEHASVLVMFHAPCEWNSAAPTSLIFRVGQHPGTYWIRDTVGTDAVPILSSCTCPISPSEVHISPDQATSVPQESSV